MTIHKAEPTKAELNEVRYDFSSKLVPGKLIKRYKRFLADVELDNGEVVVAHCPNSGSMLTCIEENAPVYLSPSNNPKRKTAYTWEMIYMNNGWIGVNTLAPNHLAVEAAKKQALPLFENALEVYPEYKTSAHTRLDLMVKREQGPLYVEVKNVTMVNGNRALFPDAKTERGAKHLKELMELNQNNAQAAMLYIIQRGEAETFGPASEIDPNYAHLYYEARKKGVRIVAVCAKVSPNGIYLDHLVPLED